MIWYAYHIQNIAWWSYAEMPKEEKNKISHRSKALALVKSHFAAADYIFQTDGSH